MSGRPTAELYPSLVSIPLGLAFTWALFSSLPVLTTGRAVDMTSKLPIIVELIELPPPPVVKPPPPPKPVVEKKKPPPVVKPSPKPVAVEKPPVKPEPKPVRSAEPPPVALPPTATSPGPATVSAAPPVHSFVPETAPTSEPAAVYVEDSGPPPPEALPVPVPFFRLTATPAFLHRETPVFPDEMKRIGRSGTVEVKALIDVDGRVRDVTVLTSAGDVFDEAAVKALFSSRFTPGKVDGKPVAVFYRTTVRFLLK